jgi:hypothetical protein
MSIKGPLIQQGINNDNNTTRLMEVDTLYANIITDGIATIENGYITNLIEPSLGDEIATKEYVDTSGGGSGSTGPNGSVQYNSSGSFAGSSNLTLTNPGLPSATLNLVTLTNGTMTLTGSQFTGLNNPTTSQEAATKNYVDENVNKLGNITINLEQNIAYLFTPAQIYNNFINLTIDPNNFTGFCHLDQFPLASDVKTYLGSEFVVGKSWTTIFSLPSTGNILLTRFISGSLDIGNIFIPITYLYCTIALPESTGINYSKITTLSIVTNDTVGSEQYYTYVISNFNDITTNAQITDKGVLTPSFANASLLGTGSIIYPIPSSPIINSVASIVYTYSNLKQFLIIRTGLTANTVDTFVSADVFVADDNFSMGGGTFRFFIQNPTIHNLTLNPSTGWTIQSGNSNIIPGGYCGAFWITVVVSAASCHIHTISISPING